jgi:hypothetical protein
LIYSWLLHGEWPSMAKRIVKHISTALPNRDWAHCSFHYLLGLSFADMQSHQSSSLHDLPAKK